MDIFEKQQTIEAIRTIVKARWFYATAVLAQGIILKIMFPSSPLPSDLFIPLTFVSVLALNFSYWIYLRRKPENINSLTLKFIKFSQVLIDQLAIVAIIYFSGTASKGIVMMYIVSIMVASVLYKSKGVALWSFVAIFLYSSLVILEYFGLLPALSPEAASQSPYKFLKGELNFVKYQLIGVNFYFVAAAVYAGYLASIFMKREKRLQEKTDEAIKKSQLLTLQTQELTKTQGELQSSLTKSDTARKAATQARDEAQKANLELKKKIDELEKFYKITVGREVKMAEMKKRIKELEKNKDKEETS